MCIPKTGFSILYTCKNNRKRHETKHKSDLIQHQTGNGLRHASGPVRSNLPPVTFISPRNFQCAYFPFDSHNFDILSWLKFNHLNPRESNCYCIYIFISPHFIFFGQQQSSKPVSVLVVISTLLFEAFYLKCTLNLLTLPGEN